MSDSGSLSLPVPSASRSKADYAVPRNDATCLGRYRACIMDDKSQKVGYVCVDGSGDTDIDTVCSHHFSDIGGVQCSQFERPVVPCTEENSKVSPTTLAGLQGFECDEYYQPCLTDANTIGVECTTYPPSLINSTSSTNFNESTILGKTRSLEIQQGLYTGELANNPFSAMRCLPLCQGKFHDTGIPVPNVVSGYCKYYAYGPLRDPLANWIPGVDYFPYPRKSSSKKEEGGDLVDKCKQTNLCHSTFGSYNDCLSVSTGFEENSKTNYKHCFLGDSMLGDNPCDIQSFSERIPRSCETVCCPGNLSYETKKLRKKEKKSVFFSGKTVIYILVGLTLAFTVIVVVVSFLAQQRHMEKRQLKQSQDRRQKDRELLNGLLKAGIMNALRKEARGSQPMAPAYY